MRVQSRAEKLACFSVGRNGPCPWRMCIICFPHISDSCKSSAETWSQARGNRRGTCPEVSGDTFPGVLAKGPRGAATEPRV